MARKAAVESKMKRMENPTFIGIVLVVGVVVVTGAVFVGKSDGGQISINEAIQNSNRLSVDTEGNPTDQVATISEALRNMPNGGLVSQTEIPAPQPEVVSEETNTASSSELSATSTNEESSETATPSEKTDAEVPKVQ